MTSDYRVRLIIDGQDLASDDLRNVAGSLRATQAEAQGGTASFGMLRGAIGALGAAWATLQAGRWVLDMREAGIQARNTANTFEALSGGAAAAAANLQMMRDATRGVVDDTTLMEGANRLLLMGLAKTGDEAAKLTEIATMLGRAMGKDAASSVEDFSALLANQSIPRLDNFGISSARVRERIEELQRAVKGMSQEEAFKLAVLEEGSNALTRLGSSIDRNISEWDRLGAHVQNVISDIGVSIAGFGETIAGSINDAIEQVAALQQQLEGLNREWEAKVTIVAEATGDAQGRFIQGLVSGGVEAETARQVALSMGVTNENIAGVVETISQWMANGVLPPDTSPEDAIYYYETALGVPLMAPVRQAAMAALPRYQTITSGQWRQPAATRSILEAVTAPGYVPPTPGMMTINAVPVTNNEMERLRAQRAAQRRAEEQLYLRQALRNLSLGTGIGTTFHRLEAANWQQQLQEDMSRRGVEALYVQRALASLYSGTTGLGEHETRIAEMRQERTRQAMQDMFEMVRDRFTSVRDAAQNVYANFRAAAEETARIRSTLEGMLTEGRISGPGGEALERIAAQIENPEERRRFLETTGRVTGGQRAFEEAAAAIAALPAGERERAAAALAQAMNQPGFGLVGQTPESLMRIAGYAPAVEGGGGRYVVQPGDTISEISRRLGVSQRMLMAQAGITDPRRLQVGTVLGGDQWVRLKEGIDRVEKQIRTGLNDALDAAFEPRTMKVSLEFVADLGGLTGPLRDLVESIVSDAASKAGGAIRPSSPKMGTGARPVQARR